MKELSIEEKAKAYDKALKVAKDIRNGEAAYIPDGTPVIEAIFPELKDPEGERIRKELIAFLKENHETGRADETWSLSGIERWIAWLEKQGEQKPAQETKPFKAEHGKYYYCIKDYFCGGRKQASKGDVVQALRGLPIMGLKDASEYFLPVNFIKCNSAWSEEDERIYQSIMDDTVQENQLDGKQTDWLRDIKYRYFPQPKQDWSEEDEIALGDALWCCKQAASIAKDENDMGNIWYAETWLKSLKDRYAWKPSDEQIKVCKEVYADMLSAKCLDLGTVNGELNRLEEQLKKL